MRSGAESGSVRLQQPGGGRVEMVAQVLALLCEAFLTLWNAEAAGSQKGLQ